MLVVAGVIYLLIRTATPQGAVPEENVNPGFNDQFREPVGGFVEHTVAGAQHECPAVSRRAIGRHESRSTSCGLGESFYYHSSTYELFLHLSFICSDFRCRKKQILVH